MSTVIIKMGLQWATINDIETQVWDKYHQAHDYKECFDAVRAKQALVELCDSTDFEGMG